MEKCINCGGEYKEFRELYYKCENCNLYKNTSYSTKDELKERLTSMMLSASTNKNTEKRRLNKAKTQIEVINSNYNKKGKIYDVAAAGGFFLKAAQDDGWKINGNEISKSSIKWAKENYNIDIDYGYFDDIETGENFDAVVFWNTLEHMHNPIACIKKTYKMLVDGGLIYIRVPNRNDNNFSKYVEKLHSYEFNQTNLDQMLVNCGFTKILIENVDEYESMDLLYKK